MWISSTRYSCLDVGTVQQTDSWAVCSDSSPRGYWRLCSSLKVWCRSEGKLSSDAKLQLHCSIIVLNTLGSTQSATPNPALVCCCLRGFWVQENQNSSVWTERQSLWTCCKAAEHLCNYMGFCVFSWCFSHWLSLSLLITLYRVSCLSFCLLAKNTSLVNLILQSFSFRIFWSVLLRHFSLKHSYQNFKTGTS